MRVVSIVSAFNSRYRYPRDTASHDADGFSHCGADSVSSHNHKTTVPAVQPTKDASGAGNFKSADDVADLGLVSHQTRLSTKYHPPANDDLLGFKMP